MSLGKAKQYTSRDMIRILIDNGYNYVGCKGAHKKFVKNGKHVIINTRENNMMICRRIIKENNLIIR